MAATAVSHVLGSVSDEVAALAERIQTGLVLVRTPGGGSGSGIVWRDDGLIVTNNHVVAEERAEVWLHDGRRLPAAVVNRDPRRDLATLQVKANGLTPVPIGDSARLRVGELVLAVGNPMGLRGAATVGVVSGVGRRFGPRGAGGQEAVQADVVLAPGNSGGPLVDAAGRVVGINAMIVWPGMALAVPSNVAQSFVAGETQGAVLGVSVREVGVAAALRKQTDRDRVLLLTDIVAGSRADQAGLLPGDLLLSLDGRPVTGLDDLLDRLEDQRPDAALAVDLLRGGRQRSVVVLPVRD